MQVVIKRYILKKKVDPKVGLQTTTETTDYVGCIQGGRGDTTKLDDRLMFSQTLLYCPPITITVRLYKLVLSTGDALSTNSGA